MFVPLIGTGDIHGYFEFGKDLINDVWIADTLIILEYDHFLKQEIYGGTKVIMEKDGISGYPFKDIYTIGYRVWFNDFYAELEHYCVHPVMSTNFTWLKYRETFGDSTRISIGVKW